MYFHNDFNLIFFKWKRAIDLSDGNPDIIKLFEESNHIIQQTISEEERSNVCVCCIYWNKNNKNLLFFYKFHIFIYDSTMSKINKNSKKSNFIYDKIKVLPHEVSKPCVM